MGRYLTIGDSHIPRRARKISNEVLNKLSDLTDSDLFDYIFFTGDLINAENFIDFLKSKTSNNVLIVIGNMDYYGGNKNAPIYQKLGVNLFDNEKLTIGMIHGHQIEPRGDHSQLELIAQNEGYDILISGHTHKEEVFLTEKGILLLNPGSVTGAWSFVASRIPSFLVLYINEKTKVIDVSLFQIDKKSGKFSELKYYFIFKNNQIHNKY